MTQTVIHQPRVAWDGARAFVRGACGSDYDAFAARVHTRLGPEFAAELADSRERILTAWVRTGGDRHITDIELGRWRVRFDDLLRARPDLVDALHELTASTV
jgi:hypothetical protein